MSRFGKSLSTLQIPSVSGISKRIHGMTWQAYPVGLGTATGYILLSALKPHPKFLLPLEIALFIINIIVFSLTTGLLTVQAILYPRQFRRVALDPNKNSFIPTSVLVFATLIVGLVNFCTGWSNSIRTHDFFWIYVSLAVFVSFTVLIIWFSSPRNPWAFPVFPLLLTGVVTFNVLKIIPLTDPRAVSIFITGLFMFGGGAFMCIFYLVSYLIMSTGFLDGHQANGAFIAAGPPGFSALIIFNFGKIAATLLPAHELISPNAGEIWQVTGSIFVGTMLTGCSAVLFILAAIPYWSRIHKHLNEVLGCWATTFPNIGLILSLRFLGDTFKSDLILAFQTVLTIMVFTVYLIVFVLTIMAVWKGLVLVSDDKAVYLDSLEIESPKDVEKGGHGAAGHGKH
ncbi:voltage-dependent anion channel [Phakopsora pachyrhizi]|uniref:Voltage-dependent anion channel n=1 Tax=Phakopsora pachyrhizi TaxID=170000 RepID=A0AAV0AU66_PHAPC|nr:voltage-dependent anion channel [Phakopsora pachyrhizi]